MFVISLQFGIEEEKKSYIQSWGGASWYVTSVALRYGIRVVSRRMLVMNVLEGALEIRY